MTSPGGEPATVELDRVGEVLRLYLKALTGAEARLIPRVKSSSRGVGWLMPSREGRGVALFLPVKVDRFPTVRENFDWYKVVVTHQAGHLEFGTLAFDFARPSTIFEDWRPKLGSATDPSAGASDFESFFELFPDRRLAMVIFEGVEDARVDARVFDVYAGVRLAYECVTQRALEERPGLHALPLREAFLEGVIQASLGGEPLSRAPEELRAELQRALDILTRVRSPAASVEDSAEATLRIYQIAARLPNRKLEAAGDELKERRLRPTLQQGDEIPEALEEPMTMADEIAFTFPREVEFRDQIDRLIEQISTLTMPEVAGDPTEEAEETDGPLSRDEPFCYLYHEWDFRSGVFRDRWCRVRERVMKEGTSDFYVRTLEENRRLVNQVRARFEHFVPELFQRAPRRYDGQEIDLDGAVEMVVDIRAGATPSEKLYLRREITKRDVAVAVLLDMSATTFDYVQVQAAEASRPITPGAEEYSSYLRRMAVGVDERGRPLRKRAIDVEKEAAIVLMQALEAIGDSYALYTFSGSGRGHVEFYVIKDFREMLTPRVARRIDGISPAHATRMGAAIRHGIRKLDSAEGQTRLLFLISDGRPYDRDYGRDPLDQEYAVRDTRHALEEAYHRGIRPFCLTIDKDGADYMRTMCADMPYEVVTRVEDLPMSLVAAYPRLTA